MRLLREVLLLLLIGVAGAVAYRMWGAQPDPSRAGAVKADPWNLPAQRSVDTKVADRLWITRGPWGIPPKPVPPPPPPPPPAAVPVGVVSTRHGFEAIFFVPGGTEVQVRPGAKLPDGGRVGRVGRFEVRWTDAQGKQQRHEFFGDPIGLPPATGGQ